MIRLLSGHVIDRLRELAAESVHCCVTSPPYYGLRDYGIEAQVWPSSSPDEGRPRRSLSNRPCGGDIICEDGWRGSLGLEPTLDLYLEHMVAVCREIWRVMRSDATCWMNLGDLYLNKQLQLIPSRLAIRLQDDGWWVRSEIVWAKSAPMPESCTDRPTCAHEKIWLLTKSARYYYDAEAVKEEVTGNAHERGEGNNPKRKLGIPQMMRSNPTFTANNLVSSRNMRNVWHLGPSPFPDAHFATFPPEVPRRCILAGSKPGDTILDPFAGAGTTLLVADQLQRDAIGIELNPGYAEMARRRLEADNSLFLEMSAE